MMGFVVLTLWPPVYHWRGDSGCTWRQHLQLGPSSSEEVGTMVESFMHQEIGWLHGSPGGLGLQLEWHFSEESFPSTSPPLTFSNKRSIT